ncbi:hypothetical protein [Geothrix paludis]|uniref:hypothetical protein n=1 Tax=Geothrix paludis TaxID=2922722 RepID=UPI001FAC1B29|nr:hypothetical protein [Geothrix paludis]
MSRTTRFLSTSAFLAFTTGAAMAQMAGGGMNGGTSSGSMMTGQMGAQMMGSQMMTAEMMHGMAGTMTQMHQIMETMAGAMGPAMDMKTMSGMSTVMDDMAAMMKDMAARMRAGQMDEAMLKRMNTRMADMAKTAEGFRPKGASK